MTLGLINVFICVLRSKTIQIGLIIIFVYFIGLPEIKALLTNMQALFELFYNLFHRQTIKLPKDMRKFRFTIEIKLIKKISDIAIHHCPVKNLPTM